ncbi:RidA family protein [Rhodococcus sp. NBC_00297]|uniref:RidA family protein n=1 Tax=Rhodococcus sp. NBC_00297 TaxID=2976005 RepID=UPI002E2833BA|nr:RidA family protein [Rhodococcus sp. NBC_00297]
MKFHAATKTVEKIVETQGVTMGHAVEVGDLIFLTGLISVDTETGQLTDGDIDHSARGTLALVEGILGDLGLTLDNVVKVTAYLPDAADFKGWNAVFNERFSHPRPLRTTLITGLLAGKIELEVMAARQPRS